MLSRVFNKPTPKRSPPPGESSLRSVSIYEYEEFIFGFMDDDIPLVLLDEFNDNGKKRICDNYTTESGDITISTFQMTLRQVLRASVGVIGESLLGMTEKVVLSGGKICTLKRFTKVFVRKREFGSRIEKFGQIGNECEYLVPVIAYLYTKRIKFVVCDYYPMGSLADLLSGSKEQGQTALKWKHRLKIVQCVAKAIFFIHSQNPSKEKSLQLNVHGNIKSSNIMVKIDFTAGLSGYGFVQLAEQVVEAVDTGQVSPRASSLPQRGYVNTISKKSDIYNFGVVLLDILEWPKHVPLEVKNIDDFPEMSSRKKKQAANVLELALSCTNNLADARPTIEHVLSCLGDIN